MKKRLVSILGSCLFLLLAVCMATLPAAADNTLPVVKPFAKNGILGANIAFSAGDFTQNQLAGAKVTAIQVTEVPSQSLGVFTFQGMAVESGQRIALDQLSLLAFVPAVEGEVSVMLRFQPLAQQGKTELQGQESVMRVNLRKSFNFAPSAPDLSLTTYRNMPIALQLTAYDAEHEAVTCVVTQAPSSGTLTQTEAGWVFTPKAGKTGKVTFTYYAIDPMGNSSDPATVTIQVKKVKAPVTYADLAGSTLEYAAVRLAESGAYVGATTGNTRLFEKDTVLTRGEFLAMAVTALDLPLNAPVAASPAEGLGWQSAYVAAALESGVINTLRTEDPITMAEAATIVYRLLGKGADRPAALEVTPAWAETEVNTLCALGILEAESDLESALTRGDGALLLIRACDVAKGCRLGWANSR